jgi:glutathionylspermidine synthase
MDRHEIEPRPGWQATIEEQGLLYWKTEMPDGSTISYWDESHHYSVTGAEVYEMEAVARLMVEQLVEAGDYVVEHNLFAKLGIPGWAVPHIKETWESEPPMLYGRFDFALVDGQLKLLEYNADTPTCLLETAVQWHWLQDVYGEGGDQWNMVHELLVQRWEELRTGHRLPDAHVHFLHTNSERSGEDFMTVGYLVETARQAGLKATVLPIEQLGYIEPEGFMDLEGLPVRTAFKLYPWEWMIHEDFAHRALSRLGDGPNQTQWIEPIWKMMWSNKGILAVLWKLFEGHDNLLPTWFEDEAPKDLRDYVRKPLLAREGANTSVVLNGEVVETGPDQEYGEEGYVVQQFADLGSYGGAKPVLGVWTVDMEPAGLGIRESDGYITNNLSRFVPHVLVG